MCGRYTLTTNAERIADEFAVDDVPPLPPRPNIAPSQVIAVVGLKPDGVRRGIAMLRWGLVPSWSNDPNAGPRPINLRAETLVAKFGSLLREKRCIIPADGFYEWKTVGKKKLPYRFSRTDGAAFGLAGLWDVWGRGKDRVLSCCLITTSPNELVEPVHNRMPVILPRENYGDWLDHDTPMARLINLLRPFPAEQMHAEEASPSINNARSDQAEPSLFAHVD